MDWYDGTKTRKVDLLALDGTEYPLPCGHHRGGVRLLCRYCKEGAAVVAETWIGMAVQATQRTEKNVAPLRDRQSTLYLEYDKRKNETLTLR